MKLLFAALFAVAWSLAQAQPAAEPASGRDYQELTPPRPVASGELVEVIEFFYYGCPVCYETQPHVARWVTRAGPSIVMFRVPAVFTESSESFARTFYALGAMNHIARLHWPLYDNHHFDGKKLNEEQNVIAWVAGNGVDAARFKEIWHSAEVTAQIGAAKKALLTYDITGVPSFVIDRKYVTSPRMAGGVSAMVRVLDYLVQRAAAERKKP
jgi:thiol:disulfide interchange protein DsbA